MAMFQKDAIAFFSSYMIINGTVLMNVVVAVLLDAFLAAMKESENVDTMQGREQRLALEADRPCLEGLMRQLMRFKNYHDLMGRIDETFDLMDAERAGALNRDDVNQGLQRLHVEPHVYVSVDDWLSLTEVGALCDGRGMLNRAAWHRVCWSQLREYVLQLLDDTVSVLAARRCRACCLSLQGLLLVAAGLAACRIRKAGLGATAREWADCLSCFDWQAQALD